MPHSYVRHQIALEWRNETSEHYICTRRDAEGRAANHSSSCRRGRSVIWPAALESRRTVRLGVSVSRTMDILEQAVRATEEIIGAEKHANVLIHDYPTGPYGSGGRMAFVTIDPRKSGLTLLHTGSTRILGNRRSLDSWAVRYSSHSGLPAMCLTMVVACISIPCMISCGLFGEITSNTMSSGGMFVDLYNNLGEEAFRRGFTNLNIRTWGFVPRKDASA